jgi:hypothetical protein
MNCCQCNILLGVGQRNCVTVADSWGYTAEVTCSLHGKAVIYIPNVVRSDCRSAAADDYWHCVTTISVCM